MRRYDSMGSVRGSLPRLWCPHDQGTSESSTEQADHSETDAEGDASELDDAETVTIDVILV